MQGLGKLQARLRDETDEKILKFIKNKPGTYFNEITETLKMSKKTVINSINRLLKSKQIILLKDSNNSDFSKLKNKPRAKCFVCYYPELEKSADIFKIKITKDWGSSEIGYKIDPLKSSVTKKLLFYKQMSDRISGLYWKVIEKFWEAEKLDHDFDVLTEKKVKNEYDISYLKNIPSMKAKAESNKQIIKETVGADIPKSDLDLYVKLARFDMQFDNRNIWTEYEKIMMSHAMNTGHSINEISGIVGYSPKYCSKLKNAYPFDKDDPRYPEFKKRLGVCPCCGKSIADSLSDSVKQANSNN